MSTNPMLSLIVAKSRNGVIGVDGDLPWRLSSDLKFFKATTLGKPVLMGRVTWESLPFALPGRPNLVLTRNSDYSAPKAEVFTDLHAMIGRGYELAGLTGTDEVMLIGGATLYAKLMPYVDRMYITDVDAMIEGDAHFPAVQASEWTLVSETPHVQTDKDDHPFVVKVYERRSDL
ncbi:dihydrofolate reductase [Fretibacter rubidus]|uniref:dihydrofolate reductase n=1 Tax=Fretibacter rubidus TaxID=570162 RepID=UPI00352A0C2D